MKWFRLAAKQGEDDAQFNLARCYEHGAGVTKNYEKASEWYAKAAEQGNEDAEEALRRMIKMQKH